MPQLLSKIITFQGFTWNLLMQFCRLLKTFFSQVLINHMMELFVLFGLSKVPFKLTLCIFFLVFVVQLGTLGNHLTRQVRLILLRHHVISELLARHCYVVFFNLHLIANSHHLVDVSHLRLRLFIICLKELVDVFYLIWIVFVDFLQDLLCDIECCRCLFRVYGICQFLD